MSKERLEELLNDLPSSIRHSGELEPLKQFMREQAKRVQELKKAFRIENQLHLEANEDANELDKQNKRYREAINESIKRIKDDGEYNQLHYDIENILNQALESDEG